MNVIDYIDWDEGRDFAAASHAEAHGKCENCGSTGERLTRVPEFDYMGCDDCMEEALAVIKRRDCEHLNVRTEEYDDGDGYRTFEAIICCDCGEELIERKGELVPLRKRRAA